MPAPPAPPPPPSSLLAAADTLDAAFKGLLPTGELLGGGGGGSEGAAAVAEHARSLASAAATIAAGLARARAAHPPDRLDALREEHATLTAELASKEALLEDAVAQTTAWQARVGELIAAHAAADALPRE